MDLFALTLGLLPMGLVALLASTIYLSITTRLESGEVAGLFYLALCLGVAGSILLFIARLPLYRQRKFWTFGPSQLDQQHRRFYWLSYAHLVPSICLFLLIYITRN